jgi:endonuclease-3
MQKNTKEILSHLDKLYGEVPPFLKHNTPFQLLIAVILSAQTTDALVNKVTPDLFAKYPDAKSLKNAELSDVEKLIGRINYYRTKARNIIKTAGMIDGVFNGNIPNNITDLITLAGVGRKVANVIVAEIFNIPEGVVVDTHVKRVSYRIGWTDSQDPKKIEQDLIKSWSKKNYINSPKHLILIGRNFCFPKKPDCENCPVSKWCLKRL